MSDLDLLKEFTEDVNKQQMSIHAYTLFVTGLVDKLTDKISELENDVLNYEHELVGEDI